MEPEVAADERVGVIECPECSRAVPLPETCYLATFDCPGCGVGFQIELPEVSRALH